MKCPYCMHETNLNKPYCIHCGSSLSKQNLNTYPGQNQNYNFNQNKNSFDIELQNAYIGPKANNFRKDVFNVGAFFFGVFYLVYRKMYAFAIGITLISTLFVIYFPELSEIFDIFSFVLAFGVNKLYLKHVENKVNRIKSRSSTTSPSELLEICRKKGGTNVVAAIISPIIFVVAIFIIMFVLLLSIGEEAFDNMYNEEYNDSDINETNTNYSSDVENKNLTYSISKYFNEKNSYYAGEILHSLSDNDNNCSVLSYNRTKYKNNTKEDLTYFINERLLILPSGEHVVDEKNINGHLWYYYKEDGNTPIYHYVTTYNDEVYYIKFTSYVPGPLCISAHNNLESTMKFMVNY